MKAITTNQLQQQIVAASKKSKEQNSATDQS